MGGKGREWGRERKGRREKEGKGEGEGGERREGGRLRHGFWGDGRPWKTLPVKVIQGHEFWNH